MTTLRTERLTLRPPSLDDAPAFVLTMGAYDVARWMTPIPWPFTLSMARDWLAEVIAPQSNRAMFIIEQDGLMVGGVTISPELGFGIKRSHWGRGIGTEAVRAVLGWYFTSSEQDGITCAAQINNVASLRLQQKLGFLPIGGDLRFSHALQHNVEHVVSQLTRHAWLGQDLLGQDLLGQDLRPAMSANEDERRVI
jgi:RimJ/RimL family protein N-acetyltransferase